jgi:hypothetical protein
VSPGNNGLNNACLSARGFALACCLPGNGDRAGDQPSRLVGIGTQQGISRGRYRHETLELLCFVVDGSRCIVWVFSGAAELSTWGVGHRLKSETLSAEARESYIYVVGEKHSGKSAAFNIALRPHAVQKAGSDLVDFLCIRKANPGGRSETACVWELPGDDEVAHALSSKEKVMVIAIIAINGLPVDHDDKAVTAGTHSSATSSIFPACEVHQHRCSGHHCRSFSTFPSR